MADRFDEPSHVLDERNNEARNIRRSADGVQEEQRIPNTPFANTREKDRLSNLIRRCRLHRIRLGNREEDVQRVDQTLDTYSGPFCTYN